MRERGYDYVIQTGRDLVKQGEDDKFGNPILEIPVLAKT
jgi:hypothetical protein